MLQINLNNFFIKIKTSYWQIYSKYYLPYKPIYEEDFSIAKTILIAGSARSGTTWLGTVCAELLNARPMFEPFIMNTKKEFYFSSSVFKRFWNDKTRAKLLMNYSPYITSKFNISFKLYKQIENILKGKVRSQWIDREVDFDKKYQRRLIKEVRANLMLNFLANEWPQVKIIWIVRNPFQVIQSQLFLSVRYNWSFDFDNLVLEQETLIQDWLAPFLERIKKAKTLPERLMHRWCIENYVPFNQKVYNLSNVLLVSYDRLISSEHEWKKIFSFLGCNIPDLEILKKYITKPSHTSIKRSSEELKSVLQQVGYSDSILEELLNLYQLVDLVN